MYKKMSTKIIVGSKAKKSTYVKKTKYNTKNYSKMYKNVTGKPLGGFKISRFIDGTPCLVNNTSLLPIAAVQAAGSALITINNLYNENVSSNIYNVPFTLQFSLDQVAGYTDIVNIADKYCIYGVQVRARYSCNDIVGTSNVMNCIPAIRWVADYDDAQILAPGLIRQKMGLKTKRLDKSDAIMYIAPRTVSPVYQDGVTTAYSNNKIKYIDSNNGSVQHYGIKGYIENMPLPPSSDARSQVNFEVKYYIRAKNLQ